MMMFTFPQCHLDLEYVIPELINFLNQRTNNKVEDFIACQEKHQDENLHIHVLVFNQKPVTFSKRLLQQLYILGCHPNLLICKNRLYSINYLTKDPVRLVGSQLFQEDFKLLKQDEQKQLVKNNIKKNILIFKAFEEEKVPEIIDQGVLSLKDLQFMQRGYDLYRYMKIKHVKPNWQIKRGMYIYGTAGVGKSTIAKYIARQAILYYNNKYNEQFPEEVYQKDQTKWFSNYRKQIAIILDDYDCNNILAHHIKMWTDWQEINGYVEYKGGSVQQNWIICIITSNYPIEQIAQQDEELAKALKRRMYIMEAIEQGQDYTAILKYKDNIIYKQNEEIVMESRQRSERDNHKPVSLFLSLEQDSEQQ